MPKFHDKGFDEVTLLKLDLFRQYIREWLAVFMTDRFTNSFFIFDYFCGPGRDSQGNDGSPMIIVDEIKKYLQKRPYTLNTNGTAFLYFNDSEKESIEHLAEEFEKLPDDIFSPLKVKACARNLKFQDAFKKTSKVLKNERVPCLAILDQFGLKEVEQSVFLQLVRSPKTDILFFISSGNIKRFATVESIRKRFPDAETLKELSKEFVHEGVTEFFRSWVPKDVEYYLAPFTLKRGGNTYGIIFGSHSLLGLEKFLNSTWKLDENAGDSNANIHHDLDSTAGPLLPIFEEDPSNKKYDYEQILWEYLSEPRTNLDLYKFGLLQGFLPKHTNSILKNFQNSGKIKVIPANGEKGQKGAFYIGWKYYKESDHKITITR